MKVVLVSGTVPHWNSAKLIHNGQDLSAILSQVKGHLSYTTV